MYLKRYLIFVTIYTLILSILADARYYSYRNEIHQKELIILKQAAEQGDAAAQVNLGVMYHEGRGVSQDYTKALHWYRKAAEKGSAEARVNIAMMYENGLGVIKSYSEAFKWYGKAAAQGNAAAQASLGKMYKMGHGVIQDYNQSVYWFRKAAEQGDPYGQVGLGVMYDTGLGVLQNYYKAFWWIRKAAEQGDPNGFACLAELYEYGKGVPASLTTAIHWYRKAADEGNEIAENALKRLSQEKWGTISLQQLLNHQGFDPGPLDGVFGNRTLHAVHSYHKSYRLNFNEDNITAVHNHLSEQFNSRSPVQQKSMSPDDSITTFTYYALVIGNGNYKHFDNLKTAIDDAKAVAKLLSKKYDFKVTLLTDATRKKIISKLRKMRESLKVKHNLLIYFAGHGIIDETTKRGYWLPVDAEVNNPANWIPNEDITNDLKAILAKHVLIVADACYSGTITRAPSIVSSELMEGDTVLVARRMEQKKSRTVLTSGGIEEVVLDTPVVGDLHSIFAHCFLKTLRENEKEIIMGSLFDSIRNCVMTDAYQCPIYTTIRFCHDEGGDFVWKPN